MVAAQIACFPRNARCVSSHESASSEEEEEEEKAKPFTVCEITSVRESLGENEGNYESTQVSSYRESLVGGIWTEWDE